MGHDNGPRYIVVFFWMALSVFEIRHLKTSLCWKWSHYYLIRWSYVDLFQTVPSIGICHIDNILVDSTSVVFIIG